MITRLLLLNTEHKRRPDLTNIIAGSSGGMKADDVAKKALNGIKSSRFIVPCNFEGSMLSIATAGLSPQSSFFTAVAEVLGAGFMRFMGLYDTMVMRLVYGTRKSNRAESGSLEGRT
ncbi:hypothetical protein BHE74_00044034 [Ensete ventricosum]|nr:hypothetical protein GW17_00049992 [Ensete ventricosum]RWW49758.1 hypothetical protein BHE74_00044034 [Ensete ventricosum]